MKRQIILAAVLAMAVTACDKGDSSEGEWQARDSAPQTGSSHQGSGVHTEVQWTVPDGWVTETPANTMRKAQFALPKADGDAEDASVVITFFPGEGQVGGNERNIQRWYSQMKQPDGKPTADVAEVTNATVNEIAHTRVEMSGTYAGGGMMGSPEPEKPGFKMISTIVESSIGPYFVKLVGPENTVNKWEESYDAFLASFYEDSHTH